MITHGSSCKLLQNLQQLEEQMIKLSRENELILTRAKIRKNLSDAYDRNTLFYNITCWKIFKHYPVCNGRI
ncbi:unnamed protein product [Ceratitis capitata]|uniref:(Mediterranean fruit fly) hypothetical protein n=1 Tax=Ceratitis capitata TaxID=7213 RepID=A0A811URB5_CERCA|nr:unnamed protein product [Ceratitis capitata]